MKAAFAPRVNLVRQVAEVANYPCWAQLLEAWLALTSV